jgi:hypothetical protein
MPLKGVTLLSRYPKDSGALGGTRTLQVQYTLWSYWCAFMPPNKSHKVFESFTKAPPELSLRPIASLCALGLEPPTFCFEGRCSIRCATRAWRYLTANTEPRPTPPRRLTAPPLVSFSPGPILPNQGIAQLSPTSPPQHPKLGRPPPSKIRELGIQPARGLLFNTDSLPHS